MTLNSEKSIINKNIMQNLEVIMKQYKITYIIFVLCLISIGINAKEKITLESLNNDVLKVIKHYLTQDYGSEPT
jgi:hypothetical protein